MPVNIAGMSTHPLCEEEGRDPAPMRELQGPELHHHRELMLPATPLRGLDCLLSAKIYTKMNLQGAFAFIGTKESN